MKFLKELITRMAFYTVFSVALILGKKIGKKAHNKFKRTTEKEDNNG